MRASGNISNQDDVIQNASVYGIIEAQMIIQPISFASGRYISQSEFNSGSPVALMGFDNAETLYGTADRAIGKTFEIKGKKITIVGVIKKEGKNFIGWDYDNCVMLPYKFCKQIIQDNFANPVLIATGKDNVTSAALTDELEGIMRQIRRLSPTQEDNFSLNSVEAFSQAITGLFQTVNKIGRAHV